MNGIYRRLGFLIFCVAAIHLAFFFFNFSKRSKTPSKKNLVINTHYVNPIPTPSPLKPCVKSKKRTEKPKNIIQQKCCSRPTPRVLQKQAILQEVGKTFTKMECKREEVKNLPLLLPKSIDMLQVNCLEEEQEEMGYFVTLVALLKERLELPEWGRVKLELILFNTGQVQTVHVLQTESEKNGRYLEQRLMSLLFPPFTEELKKEKNHSFLLTFCNEK